MSQEYTLSRDVAATLIPAGNAVTLPRGTVVHVVQTLGGNVTVRCDRGLFRVDEAEADAVGAEFSSRGMASAAPSGAFGEQAVWDALKTCFDPEIPLNIVDLGLVYDMVIEPAATPGKHRVDVKMTLTAQGCGMGPVIANDAKNKILALPEVEDARVVIVWDPIWTPQMISAEGRKVLGLE